MEKPDEKWFEEVMAEVQRRQAAKATVILAGPAAARMYSGVLAGRGTLNVISGEHAVLLTAALRDARALLGHVDRSRAGARELALDFDLKLARLVAFNDEQCSLARAPGASEKAQD